MREYEDYPEQNTDRQDEYRYMQGKQSEGVKIRLTACLALVLLNIVVFLYCDLFASENLLNKIYNLGSLYGPSVIRGKEYYRLVSYMFLHMGINHIGNNMILIFFLGSEVERVLGKWQFFFVYFSSGIIAGIVSIVYNMLSGISVSSVGASGAGFGLIGAVISLLLLNKKQRGTELAKRVLLFAALSLYAGFSEQGIDNAAHVGGLVAGAAITALLVLIRRRKSEG